MLNIFQKYIPKDQILFPTRRKYLRHLFRINKKLKNVNESELAEEELRLNNLFDEESVQRGIDMYEWIQKQNIVEYYYYD